MGCAQLFLLSLVIINLVPDAVRSMQVEFEREKTELAALHEEEINSLKKEYKIALDEEIRKRKLVSVVK